jgi:hypothetical protein
MNNNGIANHRDLWGAIISGHIVQHDSIISIDGMGDVANIREGALVTILVMRDTLDKGCVLTFYLIHNGPLFSEEFFSHGMIDVFMARCFSVRAIA